MTLTAKTMEWLDQNRYRSYPMVSEEWRSKVSPESGLDCILTDALLVDVSASDIKPLEFISASVSQEKTDVLLKYGDTQLPFSLTGGSTSGRDSYACFSEFITTSGPRPLSFSFVFSSHAYILSKTGEGSWVFNSPMLQTRVVSLSNGFGVDYIATNGSSGVGDHEEPMSLSGDVVLEDGYRTSPVIRNGRIMVRVGNRYGKDVCHFYKKGEESSDCRSPLFYFCGQNATRSGNIVISGGSGISVEQGKMYKVKTGHLAGKSIPCVEIIANTDLLNVYKPKLEGS